MQKLQMGQSVRNLYVGGKTACYGFSQSTAGCSIQPAYVRVQLASATCGSPAYHDSSAGIKADELIGTLGE